MRLNVYPHSGMIRKSERGNHYEKNHRKIDEKKCNGCGARAAACQEGAIAMIDGKAKLIRDDYCDGLGNCLPACPTDAISFEEREAAAYDHEAVLAHMAARKAASLAPSDAPAPKPEFTGCPGSMSRTISPRCGIPQCSDPGALHTGLHGE